MKKQGTKRGASLLTRRQQRIANGPGRSERNKYQPVRWAVTCAVHGTKGKGDSIGWVGVGAPKHARDAMRGCPHCK